MAEEAQQSATAYGQQGQAAALEFLNAYDELRGTLPQSARIEDTDDIRRVRSATERLRDFAAGRPLPDGYQQLTTARRLIAEFLTLFENARGVDGQPVPVSFEYGNRIDMVLEQFHAIAGGMFPAHELKMHCPSCGQAGLYVNRDGWVECLARGCEEHSLAVNVMRLKDRAKHAEAALESLRRSHYATCDRLRAADARVDAIIDSVLSPRVRGGVDMTPDA